MKFTVSSMYLLKELQILKGVINSSNTLPILDNFLFELDNNQLKVTASDIESRMVSTLEVDSNSALSVAIPAGLLIEILKTFPEQPLLFSINENNTIKISSNTGDYEIAYYSSEDYPKLQELESPSETTVPAEVLSKAISKTIFATGNDDLRPIMTGVLFRLTTQGSVFVATDAHKLVRYSREDITSSEDVDFIMPKKPLNILKGIVSDGEVKINYNISNAKFEFDKYQLYCRLIDGKYPNYEGVIPKENNNIMTIDRSSLLSSVRRVSILSNKSTHEIALQIIGNSLKISTQDPDYSNKADENLVCSYTGDDIKIGFNAKYLSEMLKEMNYDDVNLAMSMPNRAGILTPVDGLEEGEELLILVMPVKI
ncbi:DNA polymerase III subunit beta [Flavobacterium sp. SUN046]|uniref:DNA polymerase III subunit beta n=1 Tax=Flavobacterium sp. SUN046 TaxID=3002440 RepID=UPI002DBA9C7D|nr:DNA polymerase III subunit beta [Flavobacterium sp. SUN046]MEC4051141.1 DNA polymerase III subunit beta [Flavobacterium sp. SUN046]